MVPSSSWCFHGVVTSIVVSQLNGGSNKASLSLCLFVCGFLLIQLQINKEEALLEFTALFVGMHARMHFTSVTQFMAYKASLGKNKIG